MSIKSEEVNTEPQSPSVPSLTKQDETSKEAELDRLLITNILLARKRAGEVITSYSKMFLEKLHARKALLTNYILSRRLQSALKLQKFFVSSKFKLQIKSLLRKKKKCYTIKSSINDDGLSLKIYLDNGKIQTYKFEKSEIEGGNVVYIPRNEIIGLIVRVHFVSQTGAMIVDPKFATEFEDNQFYNTINFRKIMKEEECIRKENEKTVKLYCMSSYGRTKGSEDLTLGMNSKHNSMSSYALNKTGLSKYNKKFSSMANLNFEMKSILRPRPTKRISSKRRISFGNVQFSS